MTSIEITSILGVPPPYTIYACDVYGAFCIPVATVSVGIPPPNTITLPPAFDFAPSVGIKIVGQDCERFEIFFCDGLFPPFVCLRFRIQFGPEQFVNLYYNFIIDENINGKPSWVGQFFGTPTTLYWDGSQWIFDPLGLTNSNEDLFFGVWFSTGQLTWIVSNSYCPSICLLFFNGVDTISQFLQFQSYQLSNTPPLDYLPSYFFDNGVTEIIVQWNPLTLIWELVVNSVLYATLPGLTVDDIPIGTWILDPFLPPDVNISTVLECPENFKQFQNSEYFYFMDGTQYNFQN